MHHPKNPTLPKSLAFYISCCITPFINSSETRHGSPSIKSHVRQLMENSIHQTSNEQRFDMYMFCFSESSLIHQTNTSFYMGFRLKGKVVVITGGARGIGEATAKLFALNGAHVVVGDILDEQGLRLADAIGGLFVHCDVSIENDVEKAVKTAVEWKGRLDVMFNNAGISGPDGSITKVEMENVKSLLAVNVHGMVHGIKHAARAMIKGQNRGCIICTSSSAAIMGGLASHAYTISKEAILGLMRSSACELGTYGIRVNCISPHGVPSEMLLDAHRRLLGNPDMTEQQVSKIVGEKGSLLRGRGGRLEDIARAALFLACEDSAGFITGHNLVVDGGYTSGNASLSSLIYQ